MPKARSPNRDKAYEIYKKHGGSIENKAIAEMLGEKEKTISNWKCRDKWNVVLQKNVCSTTKEKSAQLGNKNAFGHGAPRQNKNAVSTGEFETLFFDCLESSEKELAAANRFGVDDAKLELEVMKLELASMKLGGQETEQEDDRFIAALGAGAADLWGDADDDN